MTQREYCYDVENCLDGYTVHAETCKYVGLSWLGVTRSCPQEGRYT